MRRKQKRLLQAVGLALAALVFLPNVGLWSLYRERQLEGGAGAAGAAAAAAGGEAQNNCTEQTFKVTVGLKYKKQFREHKDAVSVT